MKRAMGTVLFGLGVLFVVLAVGLPFYVAPKATKLPYDLKKSVSVVEAKGATVLQIKQGKATVLTNTDLKSTTTVVPQPILTDELNKQFKDNAVVWDVYSTTARADNGEKLSESSTEIALDRVSGVPVDWDGAWVNDGTKTTTKFVGQIYKFPFHTEKKDYKFWDAEMGASAPMAKFEAVDNVGGVEVYRFKQVIPWYKTNTATSDIEFLLSQLAPTAKSGEVWYQNTRTLWVEPVTGAFLNVREQREQELRDDTGAKTTLLKADFSYNTQTRDNSVKTAKDNKTKLQLISLWGPIGLGILGLILVIVGGLMTRSRNYRAEHSEY